MIDSIIYCICLYCAYAIQHSTYIRPREHNIDMHYNITSTIRTLPKTHSQKTTYILHTYMTTQTSRRRSPFPFGVVSFLILLFLLFQPNTPDIHQEGRTIEKKESSTTWRFFSKPAQQRPPPPTVFNFTEGMPVADDDEFLNFMVTPQANEVNKNNESTTTSFSQRVYETLFTYPFVVQPRQSGKFSNNNNKAVMFEKEDYFWENNQENETTTRISIKSTNNNKTHQAVDVVNSNSNTSAGADVVVLMESNNSTTTSTKPIVKTNSTKNNTTIPSNSTAQTR